MIRVLARAAATTAAWADPPLVVRLEVPAQRQAPDRCGRVALAAVACVIALSGCGRLVLLHDPLTAAERNDLGVAYERAGDSLLAAREYRRALGRDPRFARARVNLANLAAARARWSEAERLYRRALRDQPADPAARNNLAWVLLARGRRLDEAEGLARSAVALAPEDSIPRATLGEILSAQASRRDRERAQHRDKRGERP